MGIQFKCETHQTSNMDILLKWIIFHLFLSVTPIAGQCPSSSAGQPQMTSSGTCYIFVSTHLSWSAADSFCHEEYGGASAQILNEETLNGTGGFMSGQSADTIWIGANTMYTAWLWTDEAESENYDNWGVSDSMYYNPKKTCTMISVGDRNQWIPHNCLRENNFICELDSLSVNCVDSESTRKTVLGGRCYITYPDVFHSWTVAQDNCISIGGDLAKVTSEQIQDALLSIIDENISWRKYWIGLRQDKFYWSTGTPVSNYFWSETEKGIGGSCVKVRQDSGGLARWYTENCERKLPVICQIDSTTATRIEVSSKVPPTTTTVTTTTVTTTTTPVPRTKMTQPATNAPATDPPVISATEAVEGPSTAVTAGLVVMVIIVFAILIALLLFFFYYKRRNTLLKKAARAAAARLGAENGGERVNFDSHNMGGEEGVAGPSSLFTTSYTSSEQQSSGGKHTKYTTHHKDDRTQEKTSDLPQFNSQTSLSDGDTARSKHTPNHTPRTQDHDPHRKLHQSHTSLRSDSEGGASETDDGGVSGMRRGGVRNSKSSEAADNARSSKRRPINVKRSNSKVRPADVPSTADTDGHSSPKPRPENVFRTDSVRGSTRRAGHLAPLEKQPSQDADETEEQQQQNPTGRKKKPRGHRSHREGGDETVEGHERRHRRKHREGDDSRTDRHKTEAEPDHFYEDVQHPGHDQVNRHNGIYEDDIIGTTHADEDQARLGNEHRGGRNSKRARVNKKSNKYSLESNSKEQYYVKADEPANDDIGKETYGEDQRVNGQMNGYSARGKHDYDYEPSLALQTVNTVDIDCVSDVEVDSLPDDDNVGTIVSFV